MSDVIVKIQPSLSRRVFGVILLSLAALVLLNFAFAQATNSWMLRLLLFVMAAVFFWQAQANLRFKDAALVLTREGLFDGRGNLICSMSNIAKVDRGWFSFKPSNGFLLHLKEPMTTKWSPGLFWLIKTRMGVGGAISPSQTKEMSDKLILLIEESRHGVDLI